MPKWTEEQRKAIELTEGNVLLSAAAGSGKTTVLVERVLRLIVERRADIDHILVVTFTRAAASDMRAKLSVRLGEYAEAGDERCREQLLKLDQASISTLHAFCADFLRLNFETAGVDPSFRIIDDAVDQRLRGQALDEAMEETYGGETDALISLDYGRGTRGVRAAAEILMKRMEDHPDPGVWLSDVSCLEEGTLLQWQDELKSEARRDIQIALIQLYHALGLPGCPANYDYAIRMDIPELERLLTLEDYDELYRALKGWKAVPATKMKRGSGSEPDAAEAVKRLREVAKRAIAGIRMQNLPLIQARKDAMALSGQIKFLAGIAMKASEKYMEAKAEQALLTYSDLEHFTLRALQDEELARATRQRFAYVFVDEYQDTSDVQEAVINAVCRGDNLFTVGDVKQSIYRFRLAEPRLFLEKYRAYGMGCGGSLLPLTRNFRSKRGILDFVNLVFQRLMTGGDSEIMYDALARLNPGLEEDPPKAPDVRTQIILVERPQGTKRKRPLRQMRS